jgi:hypothetical protein
MSGKGFPLHESFHLSVFFHFEGNLDRPNKGIQISPLDHLIFLLLI